MASPVLLIASVKMGLLEVRLAPTCIDGLNPQSTLPGLEMI